jgi:hypothetical protein
MPRRHSAEAVRVDVLKPELCAFAAISFTWDHATDTLGIRVHTARKNSESSNEEGRRYLPGTRRRIEVSSLPSAEGEYRCAACGHLLEKLPRDRLVAYRLTVQPSINTLSE